MTKRKKNQNNFKRLYWKDNKEKIMELISDLPTKYLIGRINECKRNCDYSVDHVKATRIVRVNWRGYTFTVSQKTLDDELPKRMGELYARWTFDNPIGRICRTWHIHAWEKNHYEKKIKRR